jgi:simple sugar transport system permease protein
MDLGVIAQIWTFPQRERHWKKYLIYLNQLLGVILISLIKNNLILLGVSGSWQRAAVGALLLIGITVQAINESRKAKNRRVSTNDEAA